MQLLDVRTIGKVAWVPNKPAFVDLLSKYFNMDDVPTWLCGSRENEPMKVMNNEEVVHCANVFEYVKT